MENIDTQNIIPQPDKKELAADIRSASQSVLEEVETSIPVKTEVAADEQKDSALPAPIVFEITYLVKNPNTNETCIASFNRKLEAGTPVILPTRYGIDVGMILGELRGKDKNCSSCTSCGDKNASGSENQNSGKKNQQEKSQKPDKKQKRKKEKQENSDIYRIERVASDKDLDRYERNRVKELEAIGVCKEKIRKHNLDMKLVSAHYLFGESKVLFFFTADTRVDFRELVKDLVSVFKMRIELRQIGVRDESRVLGGLAVCGRDYCCHSITDKLNPVSIKMAKEQNLSLNSMKISGPCGRLLCCLSYEYDFYREEKKRMPSEGTRIKIQNDLAKITEVNILSKKIYLSSHDGRLMVVPFEKLSYNEPDKRWEIDKDFITEMLST
jgi:cell fate regulator YaaT (PSP1 superfamily)